jgi:CRP/FNR family transcriptional regulator, cyclic AMP receptor protein
MNKPDSIDLKEFALFGGMPEDNLEAFAELTEVLVYEAGTNVFQEGEPADSLFVLIEGEVEVIKKNDDAEKVLVSLSSGDFFGEMSFIDMQNRSATVRAKYRSVLWRWSYRSLQSVYRKDLKAYTLLVMNIARELSRRLRRADVAILSGDMTS